MCVGQSVSSSLRTTKSFESDRMSVDERSTLIPWQPPAWAHEQLILQQRWGFAWLDPLPRKCQIVESKHLPLERLKQYGRLLAWGGETPMCSLTP